MRLYFWVRLTRVTGRCDVPHKWHATTGTDAETIGRFDDSISYVGFTTVWPHQSELQVAAKYREEQIQHGRNMGFDQALIVQINARDYEVLTRQRMGVEYE